MSGDQKDNQLPAKKSYASINAIEQFGSVVGNDHLAFLIRKSERLASAIHVVTQHLSHGEPLRERLRAKSLDLVEHATDPERLGGGPEMFTSTCVALGAMLETAQAAGMVSSMNAKLICDEYAALARFARDRYGLIRGREQDFKDVTFTVGSLIKDTRPIKDTFISRTVERSSTVDKGQITDPRRASILSLLKTRDSITIRDATLAIPDVSEKTIQRELLAMVDEGVLIKEGERRWSIYRMPAAGDSLAE